jgi:hypothetical protein
VKTNELGEYAVEFSPRMSQGRFGYVYSFRDGYEVDVQWVPVDQSPAVKDLKLHPTRALTPGESTVVTVGPTSSLCTDLEDNWILTSRCEIVVIEAGAGTLTVEARSSDGTVVPTMYWYTTGNYSGLITRPAPGAVSIPARGGTYRVMVGLPDGSPSEQFIVTTSLR